MTRRPNVARTCTSRQSDAYMDRCRFECSDRLEWDRHFLPAAPVQRAADKVVETTLESPCSSLLARNFRGTDSLSSYCHCVSLMSALET